MQENQNKSKVPQEAYPQDFAGQFDALQSSAQLATYREHRKARENHPYEPSYHFTAPDGQLNDPNGLCVWRGRYHLFYQAYPPTDPRQHWGHCVSSDMVNWTDMPLAVYPGPEFAVFSGNTYVEADRVLAMYHGSQIGNMIATSADPLLLNWRKISEGPVIPSLPPSGDGMPYRVFDPFLWKEKDGYYALSGSFYGPADALGNGKHNRMAEHLFFSQNLRQWIYLGELMEDPSFVERGNDGACPYFWPIGDRHILFWFSHQSGAYALVGQYDKVLHRFMPEKKVKFCYGPVACSSVHAPSVCPDGMGGLYLIFNTKDAHNRLPRNGAMSVMMHCTLENGDIRLRPIEALDTLHDAAETKALSLAPEEKTLLGTHTNAFDLNLSLGMGEARAIMVKVLASECESEYVAITLYRSRVMRGGAPEAKLSLSIDTTHNSLGTDVQGRMPETCILDVGSQDVANLRILVDKCMVEVFANGRQYLMQMAYPTLPDANRISVTALGGAAEASCALYIMKPMRRDLENVY